MAKNNQAELHKIVTLLKTGKPEIALKRAISGAKKNPANPVFPQLAGAALVARDKHSAAAPYFHKSYKIKPDHAEFQDNLARSLISSGQTESAEALLSRHSKARQNSATYHTLWALLHRREKYFQKIGRRRKHRASVAGRICGGIAAARQDIYRFTAK